MDFKSIANMAQGAKSNIDLSSQSLKMLDELIGKGVFSDKSQFMEFAMKTLMEYKMKGSSQEALNGIVKSSPVAQKAGEADTQSKLMPLMIEAMNLISKK
jgi:Arc/MetJ-type ribon-helix-helix transcriptional regulator